MNRREALKKSALLGGSAILSSALISLFQACQKQTREAWKPLFLNENQSALISSLVDTVLPATDTPGGLDVKVDMFIDSVIHKLYDEAAQEAITAEMSQFNEKGVSKFGNLLQS